MNQEANLKTNVNESSSFVCFFSISADEFDYCPSMMSFLVCSVYGTSTLINGTSTLINGTSTLINGTSTLINGTSTLINGTST